MGQISKSALFAATFAMLTMNAFAGKALECYTCNSVDNADCPMLNFDESTYTRSNMLCNVSSLETMASVQRILYPNEFVDRINTLGHSPISEDRCVKFTASHPSVETGSVTFRGCFLNGHYACRHIEEVLRDAGGTLEKCDQCKHKLFCNGSKRISTSSFLILAAFAILVAINLKK